MGKKGFISEFMNGGRIVSHGKIESLSNGFKIGGGIPFSVYLHPRLSSENTDEIVKVKCYQDENFGDAPLSLNDWTPLAISEIAPNDELLETYDVYWGCGSYVDPNIVGV